MFDWLILDISGKLPTGIIPEWMQKVTRHNGTIQYGVQFYIFEDSRVRSLVFSDFGLSIGFYFLDLCVCVFSVAALNYGVFRHKEMNATMQYIMLYDMGSSSTTATIVGYHITKLKNSDGKSVDTAQLVIKGVGHDRTLGGLEIDLRLRKFFVEKFFDKTKKNAAQNPSALVKLLKEAARVKRVLSANADHQAQVQKTFLDFAIDFFSSSP